jgi:hypothetical protein
MNGIYGRPGTKAARLREWFHNAIRQHQDAGTLPTTPKFLIYEAVSAAIIPKAATGKRRYDQDAGEAITWLRETGLVPWDWIVDRTRHIADHLGWPRVVDAVLAAATHTRLDPWRGRAPLLIVESESLAGLLEPLTRDYRIVLVPVRGQAGGAYLVNDVRPYVERGHTPRCCTSATTTRPGGTSRAPRASVWRPTPATPSRGRDSPSRVSRWPRMPSR